MTTAPCRIARVTADLLELENRYVAPAGGVVVPRSGPIEDLYTPGHFVLPPDDAGQQEPISIRDGCPATLLPDEVTLSHWVVPRGSNTPADVIGSYVKGDSTKRGPIARSSWYLLLTSRYVRILAVLAQDAKVLTAGKWSTPPPGGWITFAFDLRATTYFAGSRRKVQFGSELDGFSAAAFMAAEPEDRGWATPSTKPRTADFALDLGRAILQAKRDSGDVDQEGAADVQGRTDWESRLVGRFKTAELSFPVSVR